MNLQIGAKIKQLRIKQKVTQDALATFLGVTPQAISRWEGGNGYPDIELLPSVAEFFSVSTDELLCVNLTEREKRRGEIYAEIKKLGETGAGKDDVALARQYAAEFPSDEQIQKNSADVLCQANMWDETPDLNALKEAEKLYQTLISTTEDSEFRYETTEALAALYAIGFKDEFKVENAISSLPSMKYCREQVASTVISGMMRVNTEYAQDYIARLTDSLCVSLVGYIVDTMPNGSETWDDKVRMLEYIISIYDFVFGVELLFYHDREGWLYRVIATYRLSQGRFDEALDCLEKMCDHTLAGSEAKPGDRFTSQFTDKLTYPEPGRDFDTLSAHNPAWYILNGKLNQQRYDPIRGTERFRRIVCALENIAK